jgi:hypothetical protein
MTARKELKQKAHQLTEMIHATYEALAAIALRDSHRGPSPAWSGAAQAAGGARFASSSSMLRANTGVRTQAGQSRWYSVPVARMLAARGGRRPVLVLED